jgi:hypothetical protein
MNTPEVPAPWYVWHHQDFCKPILVDSQLYSSPGSWDSLGIGESQLLSGEFISKSFNHTKFFTRIRRNLMSFLGLSIGPGEVVSWRRQALVRQEGLLDTSEYLPSCCGNHGNNFILMKIIFVGNFFFFKCLNLNQYHICFRTVHTKILHGYGYTVRIYPEII